MLGLIFLAFAALYYDQADLVMGHRPGFYDLLAYERVKSFDPSEFTVVTGSFDVGGWENSLTILVNENNPLECINMAPYAHAVQRAIGRPVWDIMVLLNAVQESLHRQPYHGYMR